MLGLFEKDLRLTLARKQSLLTFLVVALIMGITMEGTFTVGYLTMLAAIVAVGTISYDEFDNGFAFLMTLPVDRKTYVQEKYLFSLILAAVAWCFGVVLYCIQSVIRHNGLVLTEELPMLLALIPVLYLSTSIIIPLQLRYGSEKSRTVLFIIFGIIAVLVFGIGKMFGGSNIPAELAKMLEGMPPFAVVVVLTVVSVLIAGVSCLLSIRIMEKKEF